MSACASRRTCIAPATISESLIPLGGGVRLVKGAYREGANVAYPKKRDVDDNFLALARLMMGPMPGRPDFAPCSARTTRGSSQSIQEHMDANRLPRESVEFHLLYGIQRAEQARLARERYRVRVLISYGEHWFPWYMRRLAERPANVLFVAKSMLSR